MNSRLLRSLCLILLVCLVMASCKNKAYPISKLTRNNGQWVLDGKPFSGKTFIDQSSNDLIKQLGLLFNSDSVLVHFENGEVRQAEYFFQSNEYVKQENLNSNASILTYYRIQKGVWDVEVLVGKENYRDGKLHGEKTVMSNQGRSVSIYKHGECVKIMSYSSNMGLNSDEEKLTEVIEFYNNQNRSITKKFHLDGKTIYEINESGPGFYTSRKYDLNAQLIEEIINGQKSLLSINGKVELWLRSGRYSAEYKNGKKNGKESQSYPDGSKWYENTYSNDILHGESNKWYTNGQLAEKSFYVYGTYDGIFEKWYEDGTLWERTEYANKRLINQKKWYKNGEPAF